MSRHALLAALEAIEDETPGPRTRLRILRQAVERDLAEERTDRALAVITLALAVAVAAILWVLVR